MHGCEYLQLRWLCLCACVRASECSICHVFSPFKGEKEKKKGAVFSSDLSTCVCHWVNRSCCHEWKTACGLLFGIEFQVPSSFDCAAQGERAINTPSYRGPSWGVMDRINNSLVYPRYLSLSLTQACSVWSWEALTIYRPERLFFPASSSHHRVFSSFLNSSHTHRDADWRIALLSHKFLVFITQQLRSIPPIG